MQSSNYLLSTREALTLTGMDPTLWKNAVDRGHYAAAPPAAKGQPRSFDADDLVALTIFNQLVSLKIVSSFAANIASQIRITMRDNPATETLWLIKDTDRQGRPFPILADWEPEDAADVLFTFRVGLYRETAKADIAAIKMRGS